MPGPISNNPSVRRVEAPVSSGAGSVGARLPGLLGNANLPKVDAAPKGFGRVFEGLVNRVLGRNEERVAGGPALARLNAPFPTDVLGKASKDWKSGIPQRTPEERSRLNNEMAAAITDVQNHFATKESREPMRGQHAKGILAVPDARFEVRADLPPELQVGPFKPGAEWRTLIRFSNAPSSVQGDNESARRGIAMRFTDDAGHAQDLLMTTGSAAFLAKDGPAAVAAAKAEIKGAAGLADLAKALGPIDAAKLIHAATTTDAKDESLAASTFFSRVPYQLGDYAVKFRLVPLQSDGKIQGPKGKDQLQNDAQSRLKKGDIVYVLEAQFNRKPSDMGDARIDWDSPYVAMGKITIPQQDLSSEQSQKNIKGMEDLSFKPWNRWDNSDDRVMKPLGDVNEARKAVYEASSENRGSDKVNNKRCPMGFA